MRESMRASDRPQTADTRCPTATRCRTHAQRRWTGSLCLALLLGSACPAPQHDTAPGDQRAQRHAASPHHTAPREQRSQRYAASPRNTAPREQRSQPPAVSQHNPAPREQRWQQDYDDGKRAYELGHYTEAEGMFLAALKTSEGFGPDLRRAKTLNNMAAVYAVEGKYANAEPLYRRSLAILEKLDPNGPDVATCLENYAALLQQMGRAGEAQTFAARAQAIRAQGAAP